MTARLVLAAAFVCGATASATAQSPDSPFRSVAPIGLELDKPGVWTFHFAYLPPRIVTVDIPGGGKKTAWYMVYQVWNTSDTPHTFTPILELVTKDGQLRTFIDEPQPAVVAQIRKQESWGPKLHTSVGISKEKIPVTKVDSVPNAVYGVAVWLDAPDIAGTTSAFSVYVTGLSDGVAVEQADGSETIKRKTLQVDFKRNTDNVRNQIDDIKPNENNGLGAERWIYRAIPKRKDDKAGK